MSSAVKSRYPPGSVVNRLRALMMMFLLFHSFHSCKGGRGGGWRRPSASSLQDNLTDECLRCMCLASSECDPVVRCHSVGPVEYYCGPFQVSRRYWFQAGKPGSSRDPFDFEDCVNNVYCAIETVRNYMEVHERDCDFDHRVTCSDYALIHKAGPKHCSKSWVKETVYWSRFIDCADTLGLS